MKNLGQINDPKDIVTKEYVDGQNEDLTIQLHNKVNVSDIYEERTFGWTEFEYTWTSSNEYETPYYTDTEIGGISNYIIHCAGQTLGFDFNNENINEYNYDHNYITINGIKYQGTSGSIPLTYMETDIIVNCDMSTYTFSNMVKQSIKILDNIYTKAETDIAIANAGHLKRTIVTELPGIGDTNTIYMVPATTVSENNIYLEYMYINDSWEKIGSSEVDLTDYVKNTDYATQDKGGVVKVYSGNGVSVFNGQLGLVPATNAQIDGRKAESVPITPRNLEYAVKSVGDGYYVKNTESLFNVKIDNGVLVLSKNN